MEVLEFPRHLTAVQVLAKATISPGSCHVIACSVNRAAWPCSECLPAGADTIYLQLAARPTNKSLTAPAKAPVNTNAQVLPAGRIDASVLHNRCIAQGTGDPESAEVLFSMSVQKSRLASCADVATRCQQAGISMGN